MKAKQIISKLGVFKKTKIWIFFGLIVSTFFVVTTILKYRSHDEVQSDSEKIFYNCVNKISRLNCRIKMSDEEIKTVAEYKNDKNEIFIEGFGWVNLPKYVSLMNDINICTSIKEDCTQVSTDIFCRLAYYHFGFAEDK